MNLSNAIYVIYILFFGAVTGIILITPYLAFGSNVDWIYEAFEPLCHQKISRSLCVFSDGNGYWIGDCLPQEGEYIYGMEDRETIRVEEDGIIGYKMPACSRDFGLYGAMFLAALIYPLVRQIDDESVYPAIFLVAAMVPIGLDGGIQFTSDLGLLPFVYESTNTIRLITGAIAGVAATFYAIPLLMGMFRTKR